MSLRAGLTVLKGFGLTFEQPKNRKQLTLDYKDLEYDIFIIEHFHLSQKLKVIRRKSLHNPFVLCKIHIFINCPFLTTQIMIFSKPLVLYYFSVAMARLSEPLCHGSPHHEPPSSHGCLQPEPAACCQSGITSALWSEPAIPTRHWPTAVH